MISFSPLPIALNYLAAAQLGAEPSPLRGRKGHVSAWFHRFEPHFVFCAPGACAADSNARRCSSRQQDQDLADALDSPSCAGVTHLLSPQAPGFQRPFQPFTLSQRTQPQRAIGAMSSGPWRADLLHFCPPPSPNHSSSPSFQALMNSWDDYSGHCEVSLL